jgi:hypothetical protein
MIASENMNLPRVVQCPYCVEGNNFIVMKARADGQWFLCTHCAHVVIPELPYYQCNCKKCVELERPLSSDL